MLCLVLLKCTMGMLWLQNSYDLNCEFPSPIWTYDLHLQFFPVSPSLACQKQFRLGWLREQIDSEGHVSYGNVSHTVHSHGIPSSWKRTSLCPFSSVKNHNETLYRGKTMTSLRGLSEWTKASDWDAKRDGKNNHKNSRVKSSTEQWQKGFDEAFFWFGCSQTVSFLSFPSFWGYIPPKLPVFCDGRQFPHCFNCFTPPSPPLAITDLSAKQFLSLSIWTKCPDNSTKKRHIVVHFV